MPAQNLRNRRSQRPGCGYALSGRKCNRLSHRYHYKRRDHHFNKLAFIYNAREEV